MLTRFLLTAFFVLFLATPAFAARILLVTDNVIDNGTSEDQPLRDLLTGAGHTIDVEGSFTGAVPTAMQLANIDLVIVSRNISSGNYDDSPAEKSDWNGLAKPMLVLSPHALRNSIWGLVNSATLVNNAAAPTSFNTYANASHPFVDGLTTSVFPSSVTIDYINTNAVPAGSTIVASMTQGANTFASLVDIPAGATAFDTNGTTFGARRVFLQMPEYPDVANSRFDLSDNGDAILLQIVDTIAVPEPSSVALAAIGLFGLALASRRQCRKFRA